MTGSDRADGQARTYLLAFVALLLTAALAPNGFLIAISLVGLAAAFTTLVLVGRETVRHRLIRRGDLRRRPDIDKQDAVGSHAVEAGAQPRPRHREQPPKREAAPPPRAPRT